MAPSTAQLTTAVLALLNGLISSQGNLNHDNLLMWLVYNTSYARWALEGFTIADAKRMQVTTIYMTSMHAVYAVGVG